MKRLFLVLLLAVVGLQMVDVGAADAARRKKVVVRKNRHRTTVVVHKGWPLRRRARVVYVSTPSVTVRVRPARYVAPVVFVGTVVTVNARPAPRTIVWEDAQTLYKDDDWTEFTLDCNSRGRKLWIEIVGGKVQPDWAEVVFENGDATVVDFQEKTRGIGLYSLLDFKDGRKVDHVRVVARARSDEARVVLRMQK